jgi:hypothetical protein
MKPCSRNRNLIAWLALDELDVRKARELRTHLEDCEGCRRYLAEISNVTEKLGTVEIAPDVQTSESFHRRVVARLRAEKSRSVWETLAMQFRGTMLNWRFALPMIGAAAALIAALTIYERRPGVASPPVKPDGKSVSVADLKSDLPPTIANYQMVANESLDKLDELLTRQGDRNPSPVPIYTVANVLD